MVEGHGTPMLTGWARHSLCVRSCKKIDHDACDNGYRKLSMW